MVQKVLLCNRNSESVDAKAVGFPNACFCILTAPLCLPFVALRCMPCTLFLSLLGQFELFLISALGGGRVVEGGIPLRALGTLLIRGQCLTNKEESGLSWCSLGLEKGRYSTIYALPVSVHFLFLFSYRSEFRLIKMNILKIKDLHTHLFCILVFQLPLVFISGGVVAAQLVLVTETQLFPTSLQRFTGTSSPKLITCFVGHITRRSV